MVSGCVGFLGVFPLIVRPSRSLTACFVGRVARIFQAGTLPSRLPSPWVLSAVDGQDNDVLVGYAEVHGVRKPIKDGAPRFASHEPKLHGVVGEAFDCLVQRCAELGAKPRPPTRTSLASRVLPLQLRVES
jgi:hypothetical protein